VTVWVSGTGGGFDGSYAPLSRPIFIYVNADSLDDPAVACLTISSNLERLGDLATNIAEEIIFMEEGEIIRHKIG